MNRAFHKWVLYLALFLLFLLHNDLWYWNTSRFVLGIPIGFAYHVGFCIAASLLMIALVRYAWPENLEVDKRNEGDA